MIRTTAPKPSALFLLALLLPAAPAAAQDVPFEQYELENGLTVILHPDASTPQVVVDLWYRVGAKDEAPGRSGFAHLFEHLMFMGTERAPNFDTVMEAGGAWNNATTGPDRTNYFDVGPAETLPTLLWLEADRLEGLSASMTQEKLDLQRAVVRNERRQTSENQPYGKARLESSSLLYPPGHPYHDPVIGSHRDLEAATVQDVKDFFAEWYVPNNASLVVAGDFDVEETKARIEALFGSLPRGADPVHAEAEPVVLERDITRTMTDAVSLARTTLYWHSPAFYAPGDAEMDLLGALLADGLGSALYQALVVEGKLAVDVSARQSSGLLGSTFEVSAMATPGTPLPELEAAIDAVLADLDAVVEPEALARHKAGYEHSMLSRLESLRARADQLNAYLFYYGDPDGFARDLERYASASVEGILSVARGVLAGHRLTLRVLPEDKDAANPRDQVPVLADAPAWTPPAPETFTLSSGVSVDLWTRPGLPLVELALFLPRGSAFDPEGRAGLAALTADMLDEGAGERDALAFRSELDRLGADLSVGVDVESSTLRLSSLKRTFDEALGLAADAVQRPRFDSDEWTRVRDLAVSRLERAADNANSVARRVSMRVFFGAQHPYGRPPEGTVESARSITLDEVRAQHAAAWGPEGARLLVAGDVTRAEAEALLEARFGRWSGGAAPQQPAFDGPVPAVDAPAIYYVDRPGAVQTVVRFQFPGRPWGAEDRVERSLVTTLLGGTFTSRLNQNLREDKGYTYGARATSVTEPSLGYLVGSASVRADVTGESIVEFLREFRLLLADGVDAAEASKARAIFRRGKVEAFSSLSGTLGQGLTLASAGAGFDDLVLELEVAGRVLDSDLDRAAHEILPMDSAVLFLVGDAQTILAELSEIDEELPIPVELSPEGERVGG